ncbi:hypothetical protein DFH28DRAFT_1084530 [Melampsora americana]|nr:hypothetical protein DFH28DRAFT_1084530 [Melampsora americana]
MSLSSVILLSFLILIFASPHLSLLLEKDLEESLLADKVHSHLPDADLRSKGLQSEGSSGISPIRTQGKTLQKSHTTKLSDRLWDLARPTQESASENNWNIYYRINPKVLYLNVHISEIEALTHAVAQLGDEFTSKRYTIEGIEQHIVPRIDLADRVLKLDSLELRERIWAVGVLSCLKSKIPNQKIELNAKDFEDTHLYPCRGNFELFLLKDQPLGVILDKMWAEIPADLCEDNRVISVLSDEYISTTAVWEALQRASLADSVLHQMDNSATTPSTKFQAIQKSFLGLKTPIDVSRAWRLRSDIASQLGNIHSSSCTGSLSEQKAMIQFLLHMQESHPFSKIRVLELIKEHKISEMILKVDIDLQLQDKALDASSKRVYKLLKNIKNVDFEKLNLALKGMVAKQLPTRQWGKLLRILEVSNMQNPHIYNCMDELLLDSEEITVQFARILNKLYPMRKNLDFRYLSIMDLISRCEQDLIEANHRQKLEEELLSKGVLSPQTIEPLSKVLRWNFKGDRKPELAHYLQTICVQILSREEYLDALKPDDTIIEYILHIISLKNNDKKLLQYLTDTIVSTDIYSKALKMIIDLHRESTDQTFAYHLQNFEKYLQEDVEEIIYSKKINQYLYSTSFLQV